jgi:hypothetical protein
MDERYLAFVRVWVSGACMCADDWHGAEHWEQVQAVVLSVLGEMVVASEEELALPLSALLEQGRRAVRINLLRTIALIVTKSQRLF